MAMPSVLMVTSLLLLQRYKMPLLQPCNRGACMNRCWNWTLTWMNAADSTKLCVKFMLLVCVATPTVDPGSPAETPVLHVSLFECRILVLWVKRMRSVSSWLSFPQKRKRFCLSRLHARVLFHKRYAYWLVWRILSKWTRQRCNSWKVNLSTSTI